MPTFAYEVRQPTGKVLRGVTEAESAEAARRELQGRGYYIISVRPAPPRAEAPARAAQRQVVTPIFLPVSSKSLANFFTSLRVMMQAGMSIAEAMDALSRQTTNPTLRRAAREIAQEAAAGRPMSTVLRRYPAAFNQATIAAIEAGEESGLLERTAERLAKYFDRAFELEQTYRWQTFYPKVLLAMLILIPTVPALVLSGFSAWLHLVLPRVAWVLLAVGALWYGWRAMLRVPQWRRAIDTIKLTLPWFGSLARRMATARWARALSMLLEAGVPMHRSLVAAAAASGNTAMQAALTEEARGVLEGKTVSEVIARSRQIPQMALDLIATAERSGSIEEALERVAQYYESETDVGGKQTAVVIGVIVYLIVAAAIGFYVISAWRGIAGEYSSYME